MTNDEMIEALAEQFESLRYHYHDPKLWYPKSFESDSLYSNRVIDWMALIEEVGKQFCVEMGYHPPDAAIIELHRAVDSTGKEKAIAYAEDPDPRVALLKAVYAAFKEGGNGD